MFLFDLLGGLLRPPVCLGCGAPGTWPCCARCLPAEPDDVGPWPLAADPDVALWALGPYRDALRAAVLAGKLDGQPAALTELGRRLGAALASAGIGADLVTYVAAGRIAGPPRDHAERVATGVATALDLPLVGLLTPAGGPDLGRTRHATRAADAAHATRAGRAARAGRAGRAGRADQPNDGGRGSRAGRVEPPPPSRPPPAARYRLAGGRVLLIDDLATTGGTLAGAAAALRNAGARHVEAAVLAAAPAALGPGPVPSAPRRPGSAALPTGRSGSAGLAIGRSWPASGAIGRSWTAPEAIGPPGSVAGATGGSGSVASATVGSGSVPSTTELRSVLPAPWSLPGPRRSRSRSRSPPLDPPVPEALVRPPRLGGAWPGCLEMGL